MIQRLLGIVLVIALLAVLIGYSKYRPEPNRVSGFIEADEIRLGSRLGGRVQAVHASEGDRVAKGQVLVELEPFDLLQREREAEQQLASLEAAFQRLDHGLRPEEVAQAKARYDQFAAQLDLLVAGPREEEIAAAEARLRSATAELKLAKQMYDRQAELYEQNAVSQEEYDRATEKLEAADSLSAVRKSELEVLRSGAREEEIRDAKARAEEARQAWQLAQNGYRSEDIAQAKAARDAAKAALDAIREQKKELTIASPLDGTVEALDLRPGDLAPTGAPVLSVLDGDRLWVRAYVPQNRIGMRVGQRVRVTVDSFPGDSISGVIRFIARQAEFTPNNVQTPEERAKLVYRIRVDLPNESGKLRPGMTADVWLDSISDEASP